MPIDAFAKLLQLSISPIALISGASLLLLSITNRMGRTIDRSRILVRELESGDAARFQEEHKNQLRILMRRSGYLRYAILLVNAGIFLSSLMIISVFLQVFVGWELRLEVLACLFLSVLSIGCAVVFLFLDVSAGLNALRLEVSRHIKI
jgi:hypothetical protein